ncbi:MAG TPA: c-type cytochrome, partial [Acidimicrobiales bacterium]
LVTCPDDDRAVVVDPRLGTVVGAVQVGGRPAAASVQGDTVSIGSEATASVLDVDAGGLLRAATAAGPTGDPTDPGGASTVVPAPADRRPSVLAALTPGTTAGQPMGAYQLVDNGTDRDRPPDQGGYGQPFDGRARIEPAALAACGGEFADFRRDDRRFSGPSAAVYEPGTKRLLVVLASTRNVAVLDCGGTRSGSAAVLGSFRVGAGSRGIALAADGRRAWVDVGYDHAVAEVDLSGDPSRFAPRDAEPRQVVRRSTTTMDLSPRAQDGRLLFPDATNPHLTPAGVVTCASCHPSAGADGQVWFLHTAEVPRKFRRTPSALGADPSTKPLHWDGEYHSTTDLVSDTIRNLMGGDGLLVDSSTIGDYLRELRPPANRPVTTGAAAGVARGRALFESDAVGCAWCHSGDRLTDGQAHSVVPPSTDPDGVLAEVVTPALLGVRGRGPYLHDGRAPTLRDVLTAANPTDSHGHTSNLSPDQIDDLVAYLESR